MQVPLRAFDGNRLPLFTVLALAGGFWTWNTLPFVAEDCYFYAVIARNLALRGVQSFWGTELTNGVHPLWTLVLGAYAWGVSLVSPDLLYRGAFAVPLVLLLLGWGGLNWIAVADRAAVPRAALVFPQLVYLSIFGLVYSEAHLSFFAHSLLARLATDEEETGPRPVLVGLAAATVFLSRLDSLFYVGAFGLWYLMRRRQSWPTVARMAIACALPAVAYVAVNALYFGGMTPVSGFLKSTFPEPVYVPLRFLGGPAIMWAGYSVPFGWIPLVLGCVVALVMRGRLRGGQTLLFPLLAGTAGHAIYTGFFTVGFTDWYWYYVLPVTLLSFTLACAFRWLAGSRLDTAAQWGSVLILALALFAVRSTPPDERELPALKTLRVARELGIDRSVLLLSEWPGSLAFYTHNEVVAADMLTSNRMLVERLTSGMNAFDVVLEEARRQGTPIRYVLVNGGVFLNPSLDLTSVEYMHPKMSENVKHRVLGRANFGAPLYARDGIVVWRLPAP